MGRNFTWPINPSSSGPIEVIIDGNPENISEDTVNPENSVTLPVTVFPLRPVGLAYIPGQVPTTPPTAFFTATENSFELSFNNSTGKTLVLIIDGVDSIYIPPGGLDRQSLLVKTGQVLELKAHVQAATVGEVSANFFGKGS